MYLDSFTIFAPYDGVLEGNPDSINRKVLESTIPDKASTLLPGFSSGDKLPLYIRQPKASGNHCQFPRHTCLALLKGPVVTSLPDGDDPWVTGSRVIYCWFTDNLDEPLTKLISDGLAPFDWNKVAENYGY